MTLDSVYATEQSCLKKREDETELIKNGIQKMMKLLELPNEVVLDVPLCTLVGKGQLNIENFKNIVEFTDKLIRINTTVGLLKIEGVNLSVKQITAEAVSIKGIVKRLEFI